MFYIIARIRRATISDVACFALKPFLTSVDWWKWTSDATRLVRVAKTTFGRIIPTILPCTAKVFSKNVGWGRTIIAKALFLALDWYPGREWAAKSGVSALCYLTNYYHVKAEAEQLVVGQLTFLKLD